MKTEVGTRWRDEAENALRERYLIAEVRPKSPHFVVTNVRSFGRDFDVQSHLIRFYAVSVRRQRAILFSGCQSKRLAIISDEFDEEEARHPKDTPKTRPSCRRSITIWSRVWIA